MAVSTGATHNYPPDSISYGGATGGTVTQATSRTTGVTLHKLVGQIKLVSAAGSTTATKFTVTNNKVDLDDIIIAHQISGTDTYQVDVTKVANGSFDIVFKTHTGTTTEQPVFTFMVFKNDIA